MRTILTGIAVLAFFIPSAFAQYPDWQHSGSLYILTTPDGAKLPATASEEGFPLLVRLNKEWFDFSQAGANGQDIRFASATGVPLSYEVDDWNPAAGSACIWVRIPSIRGNDQQEIKVFWGKAVARSESNGKAVFNETNGYLSVYRDQTGQEFILCSLSSNDRWTIRGRRHHHRATAGEMICSRGFQFAD